MQRNKRCILVLDEKKNNKKANGNTCILSNGQGITLIALVITIIVMLILAGVSLNATIGDNGIISKAKDANMKTGMAVLEEFLQEKYVENFEDFNNDESKVMQLQNLYPEYFYIPSNEGIGGLRYVVDSEGHALYLLKREGLPSEIKNQLVGGYAGDGNYDDYQSLNDVYGVTSNLKVYYSAGNGQDILGISNEDLDKDNPLRVVFAATNPISNIISSYDNDGDGNISAEEIKSVKDITIEGSSGVTNLKDLYNLTSLTKLKLVNYTGNLEGLELATSINYVYFNNCTISSYEPLGRINKNLVTLYLQYSNDEEIEKLCSTTLGIAQYDFNKLQYMGIFGQAYNGLDSGFISNLDYAGGRDFEDSNVTDISGLSNLSNATKKSIKYLFLQSNQISDISALIDYTNVYMLRIEDNNITNLDALSNMNNLTYLTARSNSLGYGLEVSSAKNTELDSLKKIGLLSKLYLIDFIDNPDLIWVEYLENCTNIRYLKLSSNNNMNATSFAKLKNIIKLCGSNASYPAKYSLSLLDDNTETLNLNNQTISKNVFLSLKNKSKLSRINLHNIELTDESNNIITNATEINTVINEVLKTLPLKSVDLRGISGLTTIDFVSSTPNLTDILLENTGVTDLTKLNSLTELGCLSINNTAIDITKIQTTINRLKSGSYWDGGYAGFAATRWELIKQLSNCTELTHLYINLHNYTVWSGSESLDLSKCTKLNTISILRVVTKFILPSSIVSASHTYDYTPWDFSNCENLKYVSFNLYNYNDKNTFESEISTLSNCVNLESIYIEGRVSDMNDCSYLSALSNLPKLKKVTFNKAYDGNYSMVSLNGIGSLSNLEELYVQGITNIKDISDLEGLSKLKVVYINQGKINDISSLENLLELRYVYIVNNSINNLYPLRNLINIGKEYTKDSDGNPVYGGLDLRNNCIYDKSSIIDENGNTVMINNLDIIANLRKNGSLNTALLSGNPGIIDYSILINIGWNSNTGKFK